MLITIFRIRFGCGLIMPVPRSHEQNRSILCVVCMNKAKEIRSVSDDIKTLLEKYCAPINWDDNRVPIVICGTCRSKLHRKEKNPSVSIEAFDHSSYSIPPVTRSDSGELCICFLCLAARKTIGPKGKRCLIIPHS